MRIDPVAQAQIDHFAEYLSEYDEDFAIEQIERLDQILRANLAEAPLMWGYFPLTGAPYRSYLFRVGRRTQYWIIYTVDEDSRTVDILSFWNTARDPELLTFKPAGLGVSRLVAACRRLSAGGGQKGAPKSS